LKFIDLFAGLGGFHLALRDLGHHCVFSSEVDATLRDLYLLNFGFEVHGDIREIDEKTIPEHDILCAGFPCQPFSKAGSQEGFQYPELGGLYNDMLRIIRHHRPTYLILENVPNLEKHSNGRTWSLIEALLRDEGYDVSRAKLSPHQFQVPQIRERIYIVGKLGGLDGFQWPQPISSASDLSIRQVLDRKPADAKPLPQQVKQCLAVWQDFLDRVPPNEKIPHPLWSMEFNATYPYQDTTPSQMPLEALRKYRGSHGTRLSRAKTIEELFELLPSHARRMQERFPRWKVSFIEKNRAFYHKHRAWLDEWIPQIREFATSHQKLEWNCQTETDRRLRSYVIQIRPSGVRVKRPTTAPSLVAMTATQVPIIGWEQRYMSLRECKRLQSMESLQYLPSSNTKAFESLGNAVNVDVARRVAESLLHGAAPAAQRESRQLQLLQLE
jgi:DNA (cytosine-5)-methyltransferase 1